MAKIKAASKENRILDPPASLCYSRELPFSRILEIDGSKEDASKLDWDVGLRLFQCFREKVGQIN